MRAWSKRNWPWALPAAAVLAGVGAWLFFGYFAFHTILIDEEVDEAVPFFAAGPAPSGIEGDETTEEMADAMNEAMAGDDMPMVDEVDEPMPPMAGDEAPSDDGGAHVEATGSFISRSHPTEGSALVLGDGSGQRFLRFEDFRTDNGPDLNVYLSAAPPDAPAPDFVNDFVDLGDLKGNVGAQNYEIPIGLDLDHYSTVAVWCVRFGVVFGAADLHQGDVLGRDAGDPDALEALDVAHEAVLVLDAVGAAGAHMGVARLGAHVDEAAHAARERQVDLGVELVGGGDVHRVGHAAARRDGGQVDPAGGGGGRRPWLLQPIDSYTPLSTTNTTRLSGCCSPMATSWPSSISTEPSPSRHTILRCGSASARPNARPITSPIWPRWALRWCSSVWCAHSNDTAPM